MMGVLLIPGLIPAVSVISAERKRLKMIQVLGLRENQRSKGEQTPPLSISVMDLISTYIYSWSESSSYYVVRFLEQYHLLTM